MLKLIPKDKAPKTWKFRHLPLCAEGATLNHCECSSSSKISRTNPGSNRSPTPNRSDQSKPLYPLSKVPTFVRLSRLQRFLFTVVQSNATSSDCTSSDLHPVACGWLAKKNCTDHVSVCKRSGAAELDKVVKIKSSRSA